MDWGNLEYGDSGDLVANNENYNPVEFIKNSAYDPRETIPNPAYNPDNPGAEPETIPNPNRDIRRVLKILTMTLMKKCGTIGQLTVELG